MEKAQIVTLAQLVNDKQKRSSLEIQRDSDHDHYTKELAKLQADGEVIPATECPECKGEGYLPDYDTGEPNPPVGGIKCPVCQGCGYVSYTKLQLSEEAIISELEKHCYQELTASRTYVRVIPASHIEQVAKAICSLQEVK